MEDHTINASDSSKHMSGSTKATVQSGQSTQAILSLHATSSNIAKAFIVHFWFDSAFIEPCMRLVLKKAAEYARDHSDERLVIVGHTDLAGDSDYNQSLSERRARAVYSYMTAGRDKDAAIRDWNELRKRATGEKHDLKDSWSTREYQYILQDLEFYTGNIDEQHGPKTSAAVSLFQKQHHLPETGTVDDATWAALIEDYLALEALAIPESQFLPNAKNGCNGGILKWLGCGEQDPIRNTQDAWRPNRRTELLFVQADKLPCEVPKPVTFDKPAPGAVGSAWCLGPDQGDKRCCFASRDTEQPNKWLIQPAEPGKVTVKGSITFDDGLPVANAKYALIAPDGEYLHTDSAGKPDLGEFPSGSQHGRPIPNRADENGNFSYPRATPEGVYILHLLDLKDPQVARAADEQPQEARGNVICLRLTGPAGTVKEGAGELKAKVQPGPAAPVAVNPIITLASNVILVKKSYTNPARVLVTLKTSAPFKRSGTLTRSSNIVRLFTAASGGTEITFSGADNVFTGCSLDKGVKLFAEGSAASTALDDFQLTLSLAPGPTPVGPDATATMTCVELGLDICFARTAAGVDPLPLPQPPSPAPAPGTATDKWFGSRPVHVLAGTRGKRAKLIVRQPKPAAFAGTLLLRQVVVRGNDITGPDTKVKLFDTESGGTAKGNPHEIASPIPAAGSELFAEGATVSGSLRDTGFQIGIKGAENDGDRVALTVFSIDKIEAKLRATPCKRDSSRADVMPAKSSIADSKTFDATAITVLKDCGDLKLKATAKPAVISLKWFVERAADDTGLAGLPKNDPDSDNPADNKKRQIKADATGSFHIHAYVDVNGNDKRDADEDGLILNVNMIKIEIQPGAGNNRILTKATPDLYNANRSTASLLVVDSGATASPAATSDAIFANHALAMKVAVKLTGGAANQKRGIDKIVMGFIQDFRGDSFMGTYADGRTVKEVFAVNAAIADPIVGGTPALLGFPVRDHRGLSSNGANTFINSSGEADKASPATGGETRVVRFVDSPAIAIQLTHPVTGSALASISGSNDFIAYLVAFSNDFDENFVVYAQGEWAARFGTFTAAGGWSKAGAAATAAASMDVAGLPKRGEDTTLERCPPGATDNLKMDAR